MTLLQLSGMTITGDSVAGVGTAVILKELRLCFDLGIFSSEALSCNNVFISHAHTDHVGEIFNYLAVRALEHRGPATLFVPHTVGPPLRDLLPAWAQMAGTQFDYVLVELHPGAPVPLRQNITVTPFETEHRIQTFGFLIEETITKLKPEFLDLPKEEIAAARKSGRPDLFSKDLRPLFAYVPDTLPSALDRLPDNAWNARVLMVESTFLDDRKPIQKIRLGNHVRLDDITGRLHRFHGEHVVLFHFSRLYKAEEIPGIVDAAIPPEMRGRVHCFLPSADFSL